MRSENLDVEDRTMLACLENDVVRKHDCDQESGAFRNAAPTDSDMDIFDLCFLFSFRRSERGTSSFGKLRRSTWLTH